MADLACRSCGTTVPAGATTCPHCGAANPIAAPTAPTATAPGVERATPAPAHTDPAAPVPERQTGAGSRLKSAGKAIGCLVLALILLGIAIVVGVFDVLF